MTSEFENKVEIFSYPVFYISPGLTLCEYGKPINSNSLNEGQTRWLTP